MKCRPDRGTKGFTLIELLVTITAIFVLAATIGWTNPSASGEAFSVASYQLISDIRYAQSLAMGQRSTQAITRTNGGSNYTVPVSPNGAQTKKLVAGVTFNSSGLSGLSFNSMGEPTGTCASGCTV